MEIAAVISFLMLIVTWMGLPSSTQLAEEVSPTLPAHAVGAKA